MIPETDKAILGSLSRAARGGTSSHPEFLREAHDVVAGIHLSSILAAMFLLGTQTTYNLLQSYNTGTQYATVDVLDSLWNHLVGTVMPTAAVLALVGAILNFATRKPFLRLVAVALALLTVSAIWKLLVSMM